MRTRYTHLGPRLAAVLALLAACEQRAADDYSKEDLALLAQCPDHPAWSPGDSDYVGDDFAGFVQARDCIVLPTEERCPDAMTVRGFGLSCDTQKAVCITGLEGRYDEVPDTGARTGEPKDLSAFDRCCYTYIGVQATFDCGRPWLVADAPTTAPILPGAGWADPRTPPGSPHPAALARWTADAAAEHASVAAFAALTLDLLAHGFPARLLMLTARAQAEEVEHARGALQIASRLAGQPLAPGPLPVAHHHPSLRDLAVHTAVEGGLGESLAAAIAAARLAVCTDPLTRAHLQRVVHDEAQHAALAWEIVEHAVELGGDEVHEAVQQALTQAVQRFAGAPVPEEPLAPEHGLCGAAALTHARDQVLRELFGWRAAA
jgi:hypothetical protein